VAEQSAETRDLAEQQHYFAVSLPDKALTFVRQVDCFAK
jgi:hypothetical protein